MKIEIENLKGLVYLKDLNDNQKSLAITELNKLLDYVKELEQSSCNVIKRNCSKPDDMACYLKVCDVNCFDCKYYK